MAIIYVHVEWTESKSDNNWQGVDVLSLITTNVFNTLQQQTMPLYLLNDSLASKLNLDDRSHALRMVIACNGSTRYVN